MTFRFFICLLAAFPALLAAAQTDPYPSTYTPLPSNPVLITNATLLTGTWGGGGHARAAGATIPLPLDQAVDAARLVAGRLADQVRR